MTNWQDTVWYRGPQVLSRRAVYRRTALSVFGLLGTASLFVWLLSGHFHKPLSEWAVHTFDRSPHFHVILDGLEPARRAAVALRLEGIIGWLLPLIALAGIGGAAGAGLAIVAIGRLLAQAYDARPGRLQQVPIVIDRRWRWGAAAAFAAGLLAHLPFIRLSLNTDELDAVLHVRDHWLGWADTSLGWQVHVGGEFLARLSMDLLGGDDLRMRAGSAVLSAAGLSVTYIWVCRRFGFLSALLTTGLLCALPLWAEQTTLVRGYGIVFFAGAVHLWALWHILDESNPHHEPETLAALLISNIIGFAGHFFYLFFALASFSLLAWQAGRSRSKLAAAGLIWGVVGLIPVGVLYTPGLPSSLFMSAVSGKSTLDVIERRFVEEFGFRLGGPVQSVAALALAVCFVAGLFRLRECARRREFIIVAICLGVPLLFRPAYYYPRFFMFLCPLLFVATLPIAQVLERVRRPSVRLALALSMCVTMWALPQPFSMRPSADVRTASASLVAFARSADRVVIDNFLAGSQYYLPHDVKPIYVNTNRAIPTGTNVVMIGYASDVTSQAPIGFNEVARALGRDLNISVYVADGRHNSLPTADESWDANHNRPVVVRANR